MLKIVSREFEVSQAEILSARQTRHRTWPRHLAIKILHDRGWTCTALASTFARDHTTILYALEAVGRHMVDPLFSERAGRVMAALGR